MKLLYTGTRPTPWVPPPGASLLWEPLLEISPLPLPLDLVQGIVQERAALVFYSKHAVTSAKEILGGLPRDTPMWAVGEKCAQALGAMGFLSVLTPDKSAQHFKGLLHAMRHHPSLPSTLVAFGLEDAPRPLQEGLSERGVTVRDIPAYRSEARQDFPAATFHKSPPAWVLLTSPKGVEAWAQACRGLPTRIASIGPTTSDACMHAGLHIVHQSSLPDVSVLCDEVIAAHDL